MQSYFLMQKALQKLALYNFCMLMLFNVKPDIILVVDGLIGNIVTQRCAYSRFFLAISSIHHWYEGSSRLMHK